MEQFVLFIIELDWSLQSTGSGAIGRICERRLPLVACDAVIRGQEVCDHLIKSEKFMNELTRNLLISPEMKFHKFDNLSGHPRQFGSYPRSLYIASNGGGARFDRFDQKNKDSIRTDAQSGDILASLKYASMHAWDMFASGAYLHQYKKYGLTNDLFMDCMAAVEQVIHSYNSLSWN